MAKQSSSRPSFSLGQRWGIFFSVLISIAAVFSLMVMLNYLGARYYLRFPWSLQTRNELSSQTVSILKSVTNDVNVIIYYNKKDLLYDDIKDMLNDYRLLNPKISVRTVDYLTDHGDSEKVKETYADFMDPSLETNLVIFSSANGTNIVRGELLGQYVIEPVASEGGREFRNKLKSFDGEERFNSAIFHVTSGRPVRAYFLETLNSIHRLNGPALHDYQKFKTRLQINNIDIVSIPSLRGTNGVPADCKLLVIAAPGIMSHAEVENVRHYLEQGGRLFVLFSYESRDINTGLESLLQEWGIAVGHDVVQDPENHYGDSGNDVVVNSFNKSHPVVTHLQGFALELILPRSIRTNSVGQAPDASMAQELAWTGPKARINDSLVNTGKPVSLIAAVEKGDVKGITDQGTTRIVVVGDSYFLDNELIGAGLNRIFVDYAINWLMGQTQLLQGSGPRVVKEYRLMLTPVQSQNLQWIFLAAMPGGILLFGGLVWLRRRR